MHLSRWECAWEREREREEEWERGRQWKVQSVYVCVCLFLLLFSVKLLCVCLSVGCAQVNVNPWLMFLLKYLAPYPLTPSTYSLSHHLVPCSADLITLGQCGQLANGLLHCLPAEINWIEWPQLRLKYAIFPGYHFQCSLPLPSTCPAHMCFSQFFHKIVLLLLAFL